MKIQKIDNLKLNSTETTPKKPSETVPVHCKPSYNSIYTANTLKDMTFASYHPSFVGRTYDMDNLPKDDVVADATRLEEFMDKYVRGVGADYYGKGILNEGGYVDFNKCGWDNLSKNQLDITKASDEEILAFQFANAIGEAKDTSWVQRYTPDNSIGALATWHTLSEVAAKNKFAENLASLKDVSLNKSLESKNNGEIVDKNGKLNVDCIVWDTETTGINHSSNKKPLDKIIQVGSIQVKNGDVVPETGVSQLIDPQMPIPQGASNVHGIYDKDVKGMPKMDKFLKDYLTNYMSKENGVIVAYNSNFDMSMLRNAVGDYNSAHPKAQLKNPPAAKILDPFIMIQRIHPYVGAKKKLGEQYKFMFCKNLDGAHDAFADVKGTVNVLKYCLYYLNEHRVDKEKPLTMRQVLMFQNGEDDMDRTNINIPLDYKGCNEKVKFSASYMSTPLPISNYFKGYKLTDDVVQEVAPLIGKQNIKRLNDLQFPGRLVTPNTENMDENVSTDDIKKKTPKEKREKVQYAVRKNFKKALSYAELQPYKGLSSTQIIDLITEKSKNYVKDDGKNIWLKNVDPSYIEEGNDMIDYNIARRVMQEEQASERSEAK